MNIPSFTADASLYKTSGHYRSSRPAINSQRQTKGLIYPAVPNEGTYNINGCAPGKVLWGQTDGGEYGVDWGCADNPTDGWDDGSGGSGPIVATGGGGPPGGGGSSSSSNPKSPDLQGHHECTPTEFAKVIKLYNKKAIDACILSPDWLGHAHAVYCGPGGNVFCCAGNAVESTCNPIPRSSPP